LKSYILVNMNLKKKLYNEQVPKDFKACVRVNLGRVQHFSVAMLRTRLWKYRNQILGNYYAVKTVHMLLYTYIWMLDVNKGTNKHQNTGQWLLSRFAFGTCSVRISPVAPDILRFCCGSSYSLQARSRHISVRSASFSFYVIFISVFISHPTNGRYTFPIHEQRT
jgi:hypothetical protein